MDATSRLLLVRAALVLAGAAPTQAQASRAGIWFDVGLGCGSAWFSCDTCSGKPLGGWVTSMGLGGTLSPHVRLGADLRLWLNGLKAGGKLPGIAAGGPTLWYYPSSHSGAFVEGGAELSSYEVCKGKGDPLEPCSTDTTYASGTGWGFTFGAGWDIGPLRPMVAFHHGAVGRLHSPDGATVATGWKQNLLTVELRLLAGGSR